MPATREEKVKAIAELKESFSTAKVIVFTEYRGLNVANLSALRRKMREAGGRLIVSKNTIAGLAARDAGLEGLDPFLTGPTALAFGFDDLVTVPKLITQFDNDFKQFEYKGGVLEGKVISKDDVRNLAELPPREVLLAQVTGGFQAPLYGLVNVLQGNVRKLVYAVEAIREKKAQEAS
ncbi:MAG: 50S ribosomal protein L10 [Desulforudis sp.]|nr:50S ribosomal protein L10 [Clostridia bacterium]MDQ7792724.1 50S ribosomal protein L10 [Clostridia bacterium]RJX21143.1 MAG: 50S ribosomal protein L10 [Desulforudis sp.]